MGEARTLSFSSLAKKSPITNKLKVREAYQSTVLTMRVIISGGVKANVRLFVKKIQLER